MNLKSRLARLQTQAGSELTSPAPSNLRNRLTKIKTTRLHRQRTTPCGSMSDATLADKVHGKLIAEGVIQIQKRIPLSRKLGKVELAGLQKQPHLPGETAVQRQRHVYIDTETTGLSGGSGTLAFLVGMAVLDETAILLTQFLITRFAAETFMLTAFAQSLTGDDRLVSYNGKSYDLPLLVTRYRMHSLSHPLEQLPHVDLLHPTRRLFRRQWPDCRLTTLEKNLLGFKRRNDLPGAEAPAAWFSYIRHGQGENLIKVVTHNQQDILSLAAAHNRLSQAIEQPQRYQADCCAIARWLSETDEQGARQLLARCSASLSDDAKRLQAQLARRHGDWSQATEIWRALAMRGCSESVERLAKYHEHINKDLHKAKYYCERLPVGAAQSLRLRRLNEKIDRQPIQSCVDDAISI
ncbi:MAG: ribonuclease H-like domain-containing protein [Candidatus Thiodiazotropha sp. (ex Cardiolucina cf. quadrata)]|nr:ribonuclease H-like domain-containing protein [Candidatus Thiodiazotropha sp. (ex Cardiolucina cf. quadrata)]